MSRFYWFTLGVLGVWRVTHLLNAEDGPGQIFVKLRRLIGSGFWGSLFDCFYCLSVWIAAAFACAIGDSWSERLLLWPALSGAAIPRVVTVLVQCAAPPFSNSAILTGSASIALMASPSAARPRHTTILKRVGAAPAGM